MSGDFGIFDNDLRELEMELDDVTDVHSIADIETVLATMRHLPEQELQQIRDNLLRSIPPKVVVSDDIDWTSREMLLLNAFSFVVFLMFGKTI